jgi:hexulose-6-phosphate isomerase
MTRRPNRRDVLAAAAAAVSTSLVAPAFRSSIFADEAKPEIPKLRKAVKYGMIGEGGSVQEKFELIKSLGFEGVELDSPGGPNADEVTAAREKTGVVVHGVVDSVHWNIRLSDPKPEVRARGQEALQNALKDCKAFGGTTVLLVPGVVRDDKEENFEQCWERSTEEIRKAIPLAKELGIKICPETVWNNFLTKPEQLVKYVDQFDDPIVGAYFDISNMIKYGVPPADWIRALGKRLVKFDLKGYSKDKEWVEIGQGDENWPEVLKALAEVGYGADDPQGAWATAEVGGGGRDRLKVISDQMDKVLNLPKPA